ncbi:MAG: hypothetical protein ABW220_13330 [Burkholderiaceae bacterium]
MPVPRLHALVRSAALLAACTAALSSAQAQIPVAIDPPPNAATALRMVYGGPRWTDPQLNAFFGGGSRVKLQAEIREVFRAPYREDGIDKLMLVYQLTPGPRDGFRCAACVPALGAAVLGATAAGRWQLRARGLLLMGGAPGAEDEDLQMLQLGEERWALRSRQRDVNRGLESLSERLVVEHEGKVVVAGYLGFKDKPGPLACGARAAPQSTGVSVLSPGLGPRVEIVLRFNEGACPAPEPLVRRTRLELRNGEFQLEKDPNGPASAAPSP